MTDGTSYRPRANEDSEQVIRRKAEVPDHLVPLELEREFLAGIFRASILCEESPCHVGGSAALLVAMSLQATELVMREHREILMAIQVTLQDDGTASPALVRDVLREQQRWDALRLLPEVVAYSFAPVTSIARHAEGIRKAAKGRRRYQRIQDAQAKILDPAS